MSIHSSSRRRSPRPARPLATGLESLESRLLLSASPQALLASGFTPITWNGQQTFARPGQWIAQLDNVHGKAAQQLQAVNQRLAAAGKTFRATRSLGSDGLVLLNTPRDLTHGQLQRSLKAVKGFREVEPDLALWTDATTTNDSSFSSQWALNNTGQTGGTADADIDAPEAWDLARGDGSVVVGVIDSGIDYTHPDLAANIWTNPGEFAGNGVDDDGNGYIDDIHGWDFANNDNNPMDDNGHGTHVAGTIAAAANNATGVAGINWNAKLMALKFLGADGSGSLSAAVSAINYATRMRSDFGVNVRVTNNSWSGGGYTSTLYNAIQQSGAAGLLFIAAAGNGGADQVGDNNDTTPTYPASYNLDNVIAVAATDSRDQLGSFSNYGATSVDLAAPGVSILSTTRGGSYGNMSGTSMASPHVTGVAALAWSYSPSASYATIRNAIFNGVDAKSSLTGKVATGGRLNAYKTLTQLTAPVVTTAPAAPTNLSANPVSSTQVDLAWTDASSDETGFKVFRSTDGINFQQIATLSANTTRYSNTSLAASTTYSYVVRAYNAVGDSPNSNTASATTPAAPVAPTVPAAPTNLGATPLSRSSIQLTWTDASDNETGFRLERSVNGGKWSLIATLAANTSTFTNTGLRKNTAYAYRIRAYNSAGNSAYSNTASTSTLATSLSTAPLAAATTKPTFSTISIVPVKRPVSDPLARTAPGVL